MPEAEFWACTPRYFAARQKAWIEAQRREWERARFTGWLAVLPHVDAKRRGGLRITDLYRFDWEQHQNPLARKPTPEELVELRKFEADAMKIFEKQFGVKFQQAPLEPAMNGKN